MIDVKTMELLEKLKMACIEYGMDPSKSGMEKYLDAFKEITTVIESLEASERRANKLEHEIRMITGKYGQFNIQLSNYKIALTAMHLETLETMKQIMSLTECMMNPNKRILETIKRFEKEKQKV